MRKLTERTRRLPGWICGVLMGLLLVSSVLSPVTRAQDAGRDAERGAVVEDLASRLQVDWRLLPLRDGLVLTPRADDAPVSAVEITPEATAVDGEVVDDAQLRERLGELAAPVLELLAMDADGRARVLERAGSGLAPRSAPAGEPPASQEVDGESPEAGDATAAEAADALDTSEAAESPAPSAPPKVRIGDKVSFVGGVTIDENESADEVVVVGGSLRVKGEVKGTALVVGGNAYVDGRIGKELMVVGGRIELGPDSVVDGEINLVSGRLEREEGARINGRINEIGVMGDWREGGVALNFDRPRFRFMSWFGDVFNGLFAIAVMALAACAVILLGEGLVRNVHAQLLADPWKSGAAGLLFQILFIPLLALTLIFLVISIIGIPLVLLVPFALLGLFVAAFVGYVGSAYTLGGVILRRFGRSPASSAYLTTIIGVVGIGIWSVLSRAFDLPFLGFITGLLMVIGFLASYCAWTFGGGALLLYYLRWRREKKAAALANAGVIAGGGPAGTSAAGGDPGAPPSPPPSAPPPEPPGVDPA